MRRIESVIGENLRKQLDSIEGEIIASSETPQDYWSRLDIKLNSDSKHFYFWRNGGKVVAEIHTGSRINIFYKGSDIEDGSCLIEFFAYELLNENGDRVLTMKQQEGYQITPVID